MLPLWRGVGGEREAEDEVDELGVIDWAIELTAVLDHKEDFIGQVSVLNL